MHRSLLVVPVLLFAAAARAQTTTFKFSFGSGAAPAGFTAITPDTLYTPERGFGIEPNTNVPAPGIAVMPATAPAIQSAGKGVTSDKMFLFSVKVPEGNYKVTVTLGNPASAATTTVKAEARRLMLDRIHTDAGKTDTRSFTVNVRQPQITGGGEVQLDPREPGSLTWDDKLTLSFSGERPAVASVEVEKVDVPTIFLCGDSTVTDQPREPYGTWGQMLPRFFTDRLAVANYAESGETLKAFRFEKRWDKVMSEVKPGDYVFLQFGHNDLNKTGANAMWPADKPSGRWENTYSEAMGDYKKLLKDYAAEIKAKGATPVIVSPMTKIDIRSGELNVAGLRDYPQAAVEAAKEAGIACIDLNAMSIDVDKALGADLDRRAYVDGLHTNSYGGYLLARGIVEGIRKNHMDIATFIADDAGKFDPAHPQPLPDEFKLPLEPTPPRGAFGGRGRGGRNGAATAPSPAPATLR
jgi:lysophospholipase L1-like esterase